MERNRRTTIIVIIALLISILGLGIAFAAFSTTLTINGSASVEASKWEVVFEGTTSTTTLADPTITGSATEVTHPTIKSNATEISNYVVTLATPGDSVTYNFKIHNKGDYAASVSSVTIASGINLTTDTSKQSSEVDTLNSIEYKLYYTDTNKLVGQDPGKDCLEPGEVENVSLRIVFASNDTTDTSVLPSSNLTLDNLGVSVLYNQHSNGSCTYEPTEPVTDAPFQNIDGAYYTYEGKRFIGTGVDNLIITENITSRAQYASSRPGTDHGADANPRYTYTDSPAIDAAAAYCTGCRLMTKAEAGSWAGCSIGQVNTYQCYSPKLVATYNGSDFFWWLVDPKDTYSAWYVTYQYTGWVHYVYVTNNYGVRPVTDIPSTATITGSGTKLNPYVITQ